jgi:hypothetical protein
MSVKSKLKNALRAIEEAQSRLRCVASDSMAYSSVRTASRELEDAESDIKRALRELPDNL